MPISQITDMEPLSFISIDQHWKSPHLKQLIRFDWCLTAPRTENSGIQKKRGRKRSAASLMIAHISPISDVQSLTPLTSSVAVTPFSLFKSRLQFRERYEWSCNDKVRYSASVIEEVPPHAAWKHFSWKFELQTEWMNLAGGQTLPVLLLQFSCTKFYVILMWFQALVECESASWGFVQI